MFTPFDALASTFYTFIVLINAVSTYCAANIHPEMFPRIWPVLEVFASDSSERPLQLLVIKTVVIFIVFFMGGFRFTLTHLMYYLDLVTMAGLVYLFFESIQAKKVLEQASKTWVKEGESIEIESFARPKFLPRYINPLWTPDGCILYPNIGYATYEEGRDAVKSTGDSSQPQKLVLDVFTHKDVKAQVETEGLRPVLLYIHGGSWRMGSKDTRDPLMKRLVTHSHWVVVSIDHRISAANAYPAHLIDVKRAIRWTRQTVSCFGGDPNFIFLAGHSSGGQLAAVAALTQNDQRYQPGFETEDTTVRAVVSLNGSLLIHEPPARADWFTRQICNGQADAAFLKDHSPVALVEKKGVSRVPFLVVSGERDAIVSVKVGEEFRAAYERAAVGNARILPTGDCDLVVVPGAHHSFHLFWSPYAFYASVAVERWLNHAYDVMKGK